MPKLVDTACITRSRPILNDLPHRRQSGLVCYASGASICKGRSSWVGHPFFISRKVISYSLADKLLIYSSYFPFHEDIQCSYKPHPFHHDLKRCSRSSSVMPGPESPLYTSQGHALMHLPTFASKSPVESLSPPPPPLTDPLGMPIMGNTIHRSTKTGAGRITPIVLFPSLP